MVIQNKIRVTHRRIAWRSTCSNLLLRYYIHEIDENVFVNAKKSDVSFLEMNYRFARTLFCESIRESL